MAKSITSAPEQFDMKEVAELLNQAAGASAEAATSFRDLRGLFEAIVASSSSGSLAARLADFGATVCEEKESFHSDHQTCFESQSERFEAGLRTDAEVRHG